MKTLVKKLQRKLWAMEATLSAFTLGICTNARLMFCPEDEEGSGGGDAFSAVADKGGNLVKIFDGVGTIYCKFAWIVAVASLIVYFVSKADDKKAQVAKTTFIGIIIGYIIFGLGGQIVMNLFVDGIGGNVGL